MGAFVLKRLLQIPFPLLAVSIVVFVILRLTGDPADLYLGPEATPDQRTLLRQQLGLDQPLHIQYWVYISHAVTGDLGQSLRFKQPAMQLVAERLPNTVQLALVGLVLATLVGIVLGIICATRRGSALDVSLISIAIFGQSMPSFWLGLMLIMVFAVNLRWLPTSGTGGPMHLIMPGFTLASFILPQVVLLTRSSLLDVLQEHYITTARAKGLIEHRVLVGHALKNALNPVVSFLGLQIGVMMGGSVITETVFAWPGIGQLAVQSIFVRDVPVVQAAILVMATAIVLSSITVDIINGALDPRIRNQ